MSAAKKSETEDALRTFLEQSLDEDRASPGMQIVRSSGWLRGLFDEHAAYVGRALRYLGVPERDLPDACQEVFVVVARRQDDLKADASVRSWLYAIATNVARNARRTARRRPEVPTAELPEPSTEASQHAAIENAERRDVALRLLEGLDDDQREVFVLHDVEELTMAEITSALGIPLKTGYSRLRLARTALARASARARARGEVS